MSLTATQLANTEADAFNVRLRYFANGVQFTALTDLADFAVTDAAPDNWVVTGDSITPTTGWIEVTNDIAHEGSLTARSEEGVVTWAVTIHGYDYHPIYYAPGAALCCLRQITRGVYDSGWVLWWIGVIDAGEVVDDYRRGAAWQRTVRDISATLDKTDSPRLVLGTTNVLEGGSVTASSTLATPASEAGNNEFVGAASNVDADNVIDGRLATVWIAEDPPGNTTEDPIGKSDQLMIDEVFNHPVAGWSRANTWWVEVVNADWALGSPIKFGRYTDTNGNIVRPHYSLFTRNSDGDMACLPFDNTDMEYELAPGERFIVCADRTFFEAYTGGASYAKYIFEAKSWHTVDDPNNTGFPGTTYRKFDLHPTDGYVGIAPPGGAPMWPEDFVKWGTCTLPHVASWTGAGVDISSIVAGQSIRRDPSGGGSATDDKDSNTAADWKIESYPRPGDKYEANSPEWIQIIAPANSYTLAADTSAGDTSIELNEGTLGWPSSGSGLVDSDDFTYTAKTATTLTGIPTSGAGALGTSHLTDAQVWPLDADGDAMTGWLCNKVEVARRNTSVAKITKARIYLSAFASCGVPGDEDWEQDYYGNHLTYQRLSPAPPRDPYEEGDVQRLSYGLTSWEDEPWVRTVLVVIDEMLDTAGDPARAKVNEVSAFLADSALTGTDTTTTISVSGISYLVDHLFDNYAWFTAAQLIDETPAGWGRPGVLALAIARLPAVLADTCAMHGCVLHYMPNGTVVLRPDPWYPGGIQDGEWTHTFTVSSVRGELHLRDTRPAVTGVALYATDSNGQPLPRVVAPYGVTGSGVREYTGYTVPDSAGAQALVWRLYWREAHPGTASWTVKGIGEWCWPGQVYGLSWPVSLTPADLIDVDGTLTLSAGGVDSILVGSDDSEGLGQWLVGQVMWSWGSGRWTCQIDAARWCN